MSTPDFHYFVQPHQDGLKDEKYEGIFMNILYNFYSMIPRNVLFSNFPIL